MLRNIYITTFIQKSCIYLHVILTCSLFRRKKWGGALFPDTKHNYKKKEEKHRYKYNNSWAFGPIFLIVPMLIIMKALTDDLKINKREHPTVLLRQINNEMTVKVYQSFIFRRAAHDSENKQKSIVNLIQIMERRKQIVNTYIHMCMVQY